MISFVVGNTDRLDRFTTQNFKLNALPYSSFITSVTSHSVSHRWSLRHVKNGPYMISTHKFRQASICLTGYIRWSSSEIRNDKTRFAHERNFPVNKYEAHILITFVLRRAAIPNTETFWRCT